jgi:high-affinity nickel-transport protein
MPTAEIRTGIGSVDPARILQPVTPQSMKLLVRARAAIRSCPEPLRSRILWLGLFILGLNAATGAAVAWASRDYPLLLGLATIAYGFGLRHAVDADHIAAIDNTTRKFMQEGRYPVALGLFFSLGHSTIVMALSVLVGISASFVNDKLPEFKAAGSIIGMTVSCLFLFALGIINLIALFGIMRAWRDVVIDKKPIDEHAIDMHLAKRGLLARLLRPVMKMVDHSWQLYFVGLLFGLGFDTASEIGLLSLAAAGATSDVSIGYILVLPLAFTAAMTLVDSLNGILMLGAYGWAYVKPAR